MTNLKLIDEARLDEMISKSQIFLEESSEKVNPTPQEMRIMLIMEGQLLAFQMIKQLLLRPSGIPAISLS